VKRQAAEARTLSELTGWDLADILSKVGVVPAPSDDAPWWTRIWRD
jgi:hypothetical protein